MSKYLGDQWSVGDWEGMLAAAPVELPGWIAAVAGFMGVAGDEPPQSLKEYDPEWGRAFWTGTVAASCDHARMLAAVKVPVLFTHHFRLVDEATGHLMGASSDLQARRACDLVTGRRPAGRLPVAPRDGPLAARPGPRAVRRHPRRVVSQPPVTAEEVPVLVAGAGPVGTTLAMDLARLGVASIVLERRRGIPPNPKCNTTNARSMELFRRLGCADAIRDSGLPADHNTDVVFMTRLTGVELERFERSTPADVRAGTQHGVAADWPTPEPQHFVSQIFLEPVLRAAATDHWGVDLREGWELTGFEQEDEGVTATIRDVESGQRAHDPRPRISSAPTAPPVGCARPSGRGSRASPG